MAKKRSDGNKIASETFQILKRYIKSDSEYNTENSQIRLFPFSLARPDWITENVTPQW